MDIAQQALHSTETTGGSRGLAADTDRLKELILARVATGSGTIARDTAAQDLVCLADDPNAAKHWRATFDRNVATLASAGLLHVLGTTLEITDAGRRRAEMLVGGKGAWPKSWADLVAVRLAAKSLGLLGEPATKLKLLAKPDGLRAAILQKAFGLKLKGVPTASRVRSALAVVALERAFGNKIRAGVAGKSGLSAKAGRTLAGQLAVPAREFGTDSRLVAALAAENVGAEGGDFAALQSALLRRYVYGASTPAPVKSAKAKRSKRTTTAKRALGPAATIAPVIASVPPIAVPIAPVAVATAVAPTPPVAVAVETVPTVAIRPDLPAFATEVRVHATARATGWPGNRKAFISHIWSTVAAKRADWGLTEIEFKCMLAEAHRAGHIVLANADLKDAATIKDVQASAVSFKNAVFHFVRVDD
jgi:hypothetical protein